MLFYFVVSVVFTLVARYIKRLCVDPVRAHFGLDQDKDYYVMALITFLGWCSTIILGLCIAYKYLR